MNVGRVFPSIVEHRLGQPFVGVVLEQTIEKSDRRIGRDDRSRRKNLLEAPNLEGRVDHRVVRASILARKNEHRDQRDWHAGISTSPGDPRMIQLNGIRRNRSTARIFRQYGNPNPPTSFKGVIGILQPVCCILFLFDASLPTEACWFWLG